MSSEQIILTISVLIATPFLVLFFDLFRMLGKEKLRLKSKEIDNSIYHINDANRLKLIKIRNEIDMKLAKLE